MRTIVLPNRYCSELKAKEAEGNEPDAPPGKKICIVSIFVFMAVAGALGYHFLLAPYLLLNSSSGAPLIPD